MYLQYLSLYYIIFYNVNINILVNKIFKKLHSEWPTIREMSPVYFKSQLLIQ